MKLNKHMVFDKVVYTGSKFTTELRGKIGVVVARVANSDDSYVVEFGDHGYVIHEQFIDRARTLTKDDDYKVEADLRSRRSLKRLED